MILKLMLMRRVVRRMVVRRMMGRRMMVVRMVVVRRMMRIVLVLNLINMIVPEEIYKLNLLMLMINNQILLMNQNWIPLVFMGRLNLQNLIH